MQGGFSLHDAYGEGCLEVLTSVNDVSSIAMLSNYAVHKNPFKALQLTEKKDDSLEHDEWHDIRISAFNHDAYVVTIFYESARIEYGEVFLHRAKQFTFKLMQNRVSSLISVGHGLRSCKCNISRENRIS